MFTIQTNSTVPIYRQIIEQVQRLSVSGTLSCGDRLPSVRQLAESLAINPMTVSKAYNQLEQEGLVERQRGVGMVMRAPITPREDLLAPALKSLVDQAKQLGLTQQQLSRRLNEQWTDGDDS